jgi:hypothetical protein
MNNPTPHLVSPNCSDAEWQLREQPDHLISSARRFDDASADADQK